MLTNIAVLRTVKENANKAVLDALPSILFEGSHNSTAKMHRNTTCKVQQRSMFPSIYRMKLQKSFPSAPQHWLCSLSFSATRQKVSLDLR